MVSRVEKFLNPTFSFHPVGKASPWPSCGTQNALRGTYTLPVVVSVRVSFAASYTIVVLPTKASLRPTGLMPPPSDVGTASAARSLRALTWRALRIVQPGAAVILPVAVLVTPSEGRSFRPLVVPT